MALVPKVIDNKKLYLISCLTRAYGYKLRLIIGGEYGYELSIWGNKSIGLGEELLAGGQGYDVEEAIENCFEDCKDQKKLLASDTCQWIEFHDETDLDVTLTLMGYHPKYEPVHMKCIDFNKWEVGPEDGKPIVLVAQPDPSKKDTESIYSKAKSKGGGNLGMNSPELQMLAAGMGVSQSQLGKMLQGTQVVGVAPGQSMQISI